MAGNTKKLRIEILGKTKQFTDNLTKTQRRMDAFGKTATKMGKTLAKGLGLATVAAVGVSKELVQLASDAAEAGAAFEVVFGESVAELKRRNADSLHESMTAMNNKQQIVDRMPSIKRVSKWIEESKDIKIKVSS